MTDLCDVVLVIRVEAIGATDAARSWADGMNDDDFRALLSVPTHEHAAGFARERVVGLTSTELELA